MQILATRKRIAGTLPHYEYRLLVPFDQIDPRRSRLIANRSDYGVPGGPHARLPDILAPLDWLRMSPGLTRYEVGRDIDRVARHLEAVFIASLYPEMTANPVPLIFHGTADLEDAIIVTAINDITDGYRFLRHDDPATLTAERFHLVAPARPRAA